MSQIVDPKVTNASASSEVGGPVVIDLGKQRKKRVSDLRKGKGGKLLDEIMETVATLREQKSIPADAQPIIIVVREKTKRRGLLGL